MRRVVLVHGALRRPDTRVYMEELAAFCENLGFEPHQFFWSGIPTTFLVKRASIRLTDLLRKVGSESTDVICKSVGADLLNCCLDKVQVGRIINVAPGYVISYSLSRPADTTTLKLEDDSFLRFWSRLGVVHPLNANKPSGRELLIKRGPNVSHHSINHNIEVEIDGVGRYRIYDLYGQILRGNEITGQHPPGKV